MSRAVGDGDCAGRKVDTIGFCTTSNSCRRKKRNICQYTVNCIMIYALITQTCCADLARFCASDSSLLRCSVIFWICFSLTSFSLARSISPLVNARRLFLRLRDSINIVFSLFCLRVKENLNSLTNTHY